MRNIFPKTYLRAFYQRAQGQKSTEVPESELRKRAIVFAPHQDDEVLGCGGTIINKRNIGTEVVITFMTDGRLSHGSFLPAEELASVRASEAIEACQVLGVEPNNLLFLNYEDSTLSSQITEAAVIVLEILVKHNPETVYIPYHQDVTLDHLATNQIVRMALSAYGQKVTVYEYPVWFWFHWPWVSIFQDSLRNTKMSIKNTVETRIGAALVTSFHSFVDIKEVRDTKREALSRYLSQMTRLNGDPKWTILNDISNGEFLSCFFQDRELFHSYTVNEDPHIS